MIRIGNCELHLGDAIEILPTLAQADCVLTDPPYKLTSGGKSGLMRGIFDPEKYGNDGEIVPCDIDWTDFMGPIYNALRDPGHAYFMANNRHIANCENAATAAGFHLHNWLVWDKVNAVANRWYMKNCEFIGFFSKGNAFMINDCSQKQLIRCPQTDESGEFADLNDKGERPPHPTEKPVPLMRAYIENSTRLGETVLDPFMGSGSTGVAAIQCGRRFVGIEKSERFFDMAIRRLQSALDNQQISLF